MSMAEILEQRPPGPATLDENGLALPRKWSVMAGSEIEAYLKLQSQLGIQRGYVFRDQNGNIPDPGLVLKSMTCVGKPYAVNGGQGQYIIEAQFSKVNGADKQPQPGGATVWSVQPTLASRVVDHDFKGTPISMSSEEPVDPPITKLSPEEVLHAAFYVKAVDEIEAYLPFRKYNGTLNDVQFIDAPRGCVLMHVFKPQPSDTGWIRMDVDLQYKPEKVLFGKRYYGWADTYPDRGRRRIKDASQTDPAKRYTTITVPGDDGKQRPVEEPVYLDGSGQPLANGKNPVIQVRENYDFKDFNEIPYLRR